MTKTTWTLLLYLTSASEGCEGGETVFYPNDRKVRKEEIAVPPEAGMLLLHKHGRDCMLVSCFPLFEPTHTCTHACLVGLKTVCCLGYLVTDRCVP